MLRGTVAGTLLIALCLALVSVPSVHAAATVTVNTTTDPTPVATGCDPATPGVCSLRDAVIYANGHADTTIMLPAGVYTLMIIGQNEDNAMTGDLDLKANMTLTGAGAASTIIQASTTDSSAGIDRIFDIVSGTTTIGGVTIRNGNPGTDGNGGGIRVAQTAGLTLMNTVVTGNAAFSSTNGTVTGGGISSDGTLTLISSTVSNNTVTSDHLVFAGGVYSNGTLTLTNSTVSGNIATSNTFIAEGGGIGNGQKLTMTNSTVSGNVAKGINGAAVGGGIVANGGSDVTLTNSTVSGNTTNGGSIRSQGGGIYAANSVTLIGTTVSGNTSIDSKGVAPNGGGIYSGGNFLTITNSTISGNTAPNGTGGGIFADFGTLAVRESTVAMNDTGLDQESHSNTTTILNTILANTGVNCQGPGTITSQNHNLSSDHSCDTVFTQPNDQKGVDPNLGPLQVNAPGTTATHAIPATSPAKDAGGMTNPCPMMIAPCALDQRGVARPQGPAYDIGAFELQQVIPAPTVTGITPTSGPTTGGSRVTITGTGFVTGATVTFGSASATNCTVVNATTITCTTPPNNAGTVTVTVTNPDSQTGALAGVYTYGVQNPLPVPQPTVPVVGIPTALPPARATVPVVGIPSPIPPRR